VTAKAIQEGFTTAGFDQDGNLRQVDLAVVMGEVPGPNGEWMFVVIGSDFCWVKGMPEGQGYEIFRFPLEGDTGSWQAQIEAYVQAGVPDSQKGALVPAGEKTALAQERFFILSE
jgi:hypothetical protein